jgi:AAA15 family ATPase/GTPase
MLNNPIAVKIRDWFENLEFLGIESEKSDLQKSIKCLEEDPKLKSKILEYLTNADFGIADFNYEITDIENKELKGDELLNSDTSISNLVTENMIIGTQKKQMSLSTSHNVYDKNKNIITQIELPFMEYQSNGTKKLFAIIGIMLKTLKKGGVIAIDEIDAKLHPLLVRMLIRLFNSIDKNPNNAQLICSSHDVLLLDENIRRDQIWFVDKDEYTTSELYCLSEYTDVRKDSKLLKRYLLGTFNAIPFKRGGV